MSSANVCKVGMFFERPGAPKIYNRNTAVWSEYEYARRDRFGPHAYYPLVSADVDVKYITEKSVKERTESLSSLHISKVRRII